MPTEQRSKRVVVAGATGRLGLVVDTLLARGHAVRALTRTPDGPSATRLREIGAEVVYGDYEDAASIAVGARGADALFATGSAHRSGPDGELDHGLNIAEAAAAAEVPFLVYSSGDGASEDSPLPLFRAKQQVEENIRSLGIPHVILAPVYFMENLFNPWNLPALRAGTLPSPMPVGTTLQQVALADLASFAALTIERPEEFSGRRVPLASDELSGEQSAAAIERVTGRPRRAEPLAPDGLPPGLQALFAWLQTAGHHVDIASLRTLYPEVGWRRYDEWVRSQRQRFAELCSRPVAGSGPSWAAESSRAPRADGVPRRRPGRRVRTRPDR
jgi:uncharacterized protein YbjT (DUF2867 family)